MLTKIRKLFKRREGRPSPDPRLDQAELSWLDPPSDPFDVAGWDRCWTRHVEDGLGPPLFDMFLDDSDLVRVMNNEGMRTMLCAGNGISQEPRALAEAGFAVVALDFSPQAVEIARAFECPSEGFERFFQPEYRRTGGRVEFALGDILDLGASLGRSM